jgi:chromate reductase
MEQTREPEIRMVSQHPNRRSDRFHILAIPGSLRQKSLNRALIRAAQDLAAEDVEIEIADLGAIPLYNGDVEAEGDPAAVRDLKERVREADALLIATPEYNASIPGVLKNAIDWLSRPPQMVLRHKPVAIMGASPSAFGTARAQGDLRRILAHVDAHTVQKPEVMLFRAHEAFDADGNLQDEQVQELLRTLLEALVSWTETVNGSRERAGRHAA